MFKHNVKNICKSYIKTILAVENGKYIMKMKKKSSILKGFNILMFIPDQVPDPKMLDFGSVSRSDHF